MAKGGIFIFPNSRSSKGTIDWSEGGGGKEFKQFIATEELMDQAMKQTSNSNTDDPYGITAANLKGVYPAIRQQLVSVARQSFEEASVPDNVKNVHIIPLPKPHKKPDCPGNCRPINLASNILKLFEKIAIIQLLNHLEPRNLDACNEIIRSFFSEQQDGF